MGGATEDSKEKEHTEYRQNDYRVSRRITQDKGLQY